MVLLAELEVALDAAFELTGRGLAPWPDPHPDRSPPDDEYSRLTDPGRYRLVGARADAWVVALVDAGLAVVEDAPTVRWATSGRPPISRSRRVVPFASGALPLVVARTVLGDVDDAGVLVGVGDPTVEVGRFPDCGCDACDSGSQDELDRLDEHVAGVITGRFRRLTAGSREITVVGKDRWQAQNVAGEVDVDAVLADPTGWAELAGTAWLPG